MKPASSNTWSSQSILSNGIHYIHLFPLYHNIPNELGHRFETGPFQETWPVFGRM